MTFPLAVEAVGDIATTSAESGESTAALGSARSRSITARTGVTPPKPKTRSPRPAASAPEPRRAGTGTPRRAGTGRTARPTQGFKGPKLTGGGRGAHKLVIAEFMLCVILIGAAPILTRKAGPGNSHLYAANDFVRLTAVCLLFFVLALLANQPRSARWAAAFGGLVTLGTVFNATQAITALASIFGSQTGTGFLSSVDKTVSGTQIPGVQPSAPGSAQVTGVGGL